MENNKIAAQSDEFARVGPTTSLTATSARFYVSAIRFICWTSRTLCEGLPRYKDVGSVLQCRILAWLKCTSRRNLIRRQNIFGGRELRSWLWHDVARSFSFSRPSIYEKAKLTESCD